MTAFLIGKLKIGTGMQQLVTGFVTRKGGLRVVEPVFIQVRQAVGTTYDQNPNTVAFLRFTVEDLKADGFVRTSLRHSGRSYILIAPHCPN